SRFIWLVSTGLSTISIDESVLAESIDFQGSGFRLIEMDELKAPDLHPADAAHLRAVLNANGSRCTRHRTAVYAYLKRVDTHPSAEEVFRAVRLQEPGISLATVYNSLEALVDAKLAVKMCGEGPARYDCRTENHYHVRCLRTGRVRDIEVPHDPTL